MSPLKKSLIAVVAALGIGATGLYAQQSEAPPRGPGWGMMGGGYGPGGYGPGARGDYGDGPGMMGGFGPGMMRGMGPGGPGFGMGRGMGSGALAILDLTEAQRKQVLTIQDETRKKNWATMGVMHDEMSKLRDALWSGEQRDRAAITAANKRMFELRQQMLDNRLDAAERIEKVLTPQQRETLKKRWGPGWMVDPEE